LKNLRSLAKNNPNIVFKGQLGNSKTHQAFRDNDCLIISSSEEAGPLTGIESMAAGKIMISTRVKPAFLTGVIIVNLFKPITS